MELAFSIVPAQARLLCSSVAIKKDPLITTPFILVAWYTAITITYSLPSQHRTKYLW
jgi:hypothetical protein